MSIEDDLAEQERWERMPTAYKRTTPAPCPELVSERTKLELLTIDDWLKKLAEKDAMIDWLVNELTSNTGLIPVKDWRKAAQEAVKKNDNV